MGSGSGLSNPSSEWKVRRKDIYYIYIFHFNVHLVVQDSNKDIFSCLYETIYNIYNQPIMIDVSSPEPEEVSF